VKARARTAYISNSNSNSSSSNKKENREKEGGDKEDTSIAILKPATHSEACRARRR
jgi:hypothetical protein